MSAMRSGKWWCQWWLQLKAWPGWHDQGARSAIRSSWPTSSRASVRGQRLLRCQLPGLQEVAGHACATWRLALHEEACEGMHHRHAPALLVPDAKCYHMHLRVEQGWHGSAGSSQAGWASWEEHRVPIWHWCREVDLRQGDGSTLQEEDTGDWGDNEAAQGTSNPPGWAWRQRHDGCATLRPRQDLEHLGFTEAARRLSPRSTQRAALHKDRRDGERRHHSPGLPMRTRINIAGILPSAPESFHTR